MPTINSFNDLETTLGKTYHSDWLAITQAMINAFADATYDQQWIHTDTERAANESPFKTTIAHGFLSLSLLSKLMDSTVKRSSNFKMGVNYGFDKIRFTNFVPVNSHIRLAVSLQKYELINDNTGAKLFWHCELAIKNVAKPALVANWITLMYQ